jgi:hypothetical protein
MIVCSLEIHIWNQKQSLWFSVGLSIDFERAWLRLLQERAYWNIYLRFYYDPVIGNITKSVVFLIMISWSLFVTSSIWLNDCVFIRNSYMKSETISLIFCGWSSSIQIVSSNPQILEILLKEKWFVIDAQLTK